MSTTILITGDTYPVRAKLASLGGKWDAAAKGWRVPTDKADEAKAIVSSGSSSSGSAKPYRPRKCVVCGVVPTINRRGYASVKIYKTGECMDCYEERKMGY